jgi:outer membrane immunogenic protein
MRLTTNTKFSVKLAAIIVSALPMVLLGTSPAEAQSARPELALTYTYIRSNALPAGSTSVNLSGGSASFAWPLNDHNLSLIGDVTAAHGSGITASGYSLTLATYTAGVRYSPRILELLHPYGQALFGVAHSSGTLVQSQTLSVPNAGATFALNLGGGLTIRTHSRLAIRPIEADYMLTTFNNGVNNHQNNLRLSSGLILVF